MFAGAICYIRETKEIWGAQGEKVKCSTNDKMSILFISLVSPHQTQHHALKFLPYPLHNSAPSILSLVNATCNFQML